MQQGPYTLFLYIRNKEKYIFKIILRDSIYIITPKQQQIGDPWGAPLGAPLLLLLLLQRRRQKKITAAATAAANKKISSLYLGFGV